MFSEEESVPRFSKERRKPKGGDPMALLFHFCSMFRFISFPQRLSVRDVITFRYFVNENFVSMDASFHLDLILICIILR